MTLEIDEKTKKGKYEIWRTNRFNDDILTECIGVFYDLEFANGFAEYQAMLGEPIAVVHEGVRL